LLLGTLHLTFANKSNSEKKKQGSLLSLSLSLSLEIDDLAENPLLEVRGHCISKNSANE
jgi:hypothetical protein